MEQEDRKKKLAAGKEKLAAFRKKRAKKKKVEGEDSQAVSTGYAPNDVSDLEVSSTLANVSSLSDLHSFSFTGESDQYSLTSGDEWSAEESEMQSSVQYQRKLAAASQKIAELEEAVEGKQLALESMIQEMNSSPTDTHNSHMITESVLREEKMQNSFRGSNGELQEALVQRDKIIRQLTAHLQEAALMKADHSGEDPVDYAEETQRLSQQVVLLQQQLIKAGERVEEQAAMCHMSVEALQEAKAQILVLQGKVVEKNNHLQHLSLTLAARTTEVTALQHSQADLQQRVNVLQQQAADTGSDCLVAAQSAASRVVTLEQELETLTTQHAQSLQSMEQLQKQLQQSEAARQAQASEKELALQKVDGLGEELVKLVSVKEEALRKMSDLEHQVQEDSAFIQTQTGWQLDEARQRIEQLEQQVEEMNKNHRLQVDQLESLLAESSGSSQTEVLDLRNVINSQKGELLSLQEQLKSKEEELAVSQHQLESVNKEMEDLQTRHQHQESEAASTVHNLQQQMQELRDENNHYKQQMTLVQEQISSFKESLHFSTPSCESDTMHQETNMVDGCDVASTDRDVARQVQQLQASYTYLYKQYSQLLENSNHIQPEVQTPLQASANVEEISKEETEGNAAEAAHLQSEILKWTAAVQKKDAEIEELSSKLQSVMEEKRQLSVQVEQQAQATEQQTLQSDTLQRRMESRANSLFTEVTEFKEALKESELANIDLQDKLDTLSKEVDSRNLQLAASEDLMKDLQKQLNTKREEHEHTRSELQKLVEEKTQLGEELQCKQTAILQLQEQLNEKDGAQLHVQEQLQEKDSSQSELHNQLKEKDSCVVQLQEQLQEKDGCVSQLQEQLQEKDGCVSQLQEQLQEKDGCASELQELVKEKDSCVLQFQQHLQEQAEEKIRIVKQLQDTLSEKEQSLIHIQEQLDGTQTMFSQTQTMLSQTQEEIGEKEKTISQLREQLEVEAQQIQTLSDERRALAEEVKVQNSKLMEDVESLRQQLAEAHEQRQAILVEQERLVSQHQEQMREAEENLEQKSTEMKRAQEMKEEMEALVASAEDTKTKLSEMRDDLVRKSSDLEEVKTEREKLLLELSSLKAERDAEKDESCAQLEEYSERLKQAVEEKEQLASSLESMRGDSSQQLKELQQKLDQTTEQYQNLLSDNQDLSSQHTAVTEKETELVNQLEDKEQEYEILLTENEQLQEEVQSSSSFYLKQIQCLKVELLQQKQKYDILASELDQVQENLVSRESDTGCQLRRIQKKLKENLKEMEARESELKNLRDADNLKENNLQMLGDEVESLKEKLVLAEKACADLSQDREQTFEASQARVQDLQQELLSSGEENKALTSRLAAQADMFKVKQEEMVAENNDLNHQLEEVRNDAEETVHQLQKQLNDVHEQLKSAAARLDFQEEEVTQLKEELETSRASLQEQECELGSLREEGSQHRDSVESLKALNDSLCQEKEGLLSKVKSLESSVEEIQRQSQESIATLQSEIQQLQEERQLKLQEFDKERSLLAEQNASLQEQLDSCTSEIERLQQSLKEVVADQDRLKTDNSRLQQQTDALQLDFSSQMEQAQSELASKEAELQSVCTQLNDSNAQLTQQMESLQEELMAAQSEIEQKDSTLISTKEELTATKQQLQRTVEEKEMLKSNFDNCMEDMSQGTTEKEATIQQLQGRLVETSQNVDRDHVQLREMYESQLSELEDRLAAADLENQRLEKQCEAVNTEKDKSKENYNSHIAEVELTLQAAESESSRLKEQLSKMTDAREKEMADLRQSSELQLSALEENCQSLEKALAKQDAFLADANGKHQRERAERDKAFEQQLSEAYEQSRMYEMDINRAKRQLDEMRKDHQKELEETQKALENQVFDLENKCVIATSELDRLRQSLWGMEQDHSSETHSLQNRIQELEALSHRQEKQMADLQERLAQSCQQSDYSMVSMKETYQSDVVHLEEVNQQLKGDVDRLQSQVKAMQSTHTKEMDALKHEHNQQVAEVQEACRQAENYSGVLQLHMENASPPSKDPGRDILQEEIKRLQEELAGAQSSFTLLKQRLKESQTQSHTQVSKLTHEMNTLVSDKENKDTYIEALTEDLEKGKHWLQESQEMCLHLEEENKQLIAENSSLFHTTPSQGATRMDRKFESSENTRAYEIQEQIECLTEQLQQIKMRKDSSKDSATKDKSGVSFEMGGGFEPEPDSLGYLDLAVGSKGDGDYFVEESEQPSKSPKMRTKSVTCEAYREVVDEQSLPAEHFRRMFSEKDDGCLLQGEPPAGRFEPEEGTATSVEDGRFERPRQLGSESLVEGFQPESVPPSPSTQLPTAAPNPSFLPHPMSGIQDTSTNVEVVSSGSQTDPQLPDSLEIISATSAPTCDQPVTAEAVTGVSTMAGETSTSDDKKTDIEAEVSRKLKGLQDQLEEEWVLKMRSQEVELRHTYDLKFEELKRQTEHQCQQQIKHVKRDTQASFVDAVRKMRKSLEKKQKQEQKMTEMMAARRPSGRHIQGHQETAEGTDDDRLGDIVKQLHEENQELAEVRDVLLQQIAISQTQGLRQTMQHELQAVVAEGSRLSPHNSLTSSPTLHPPPDDSADVGPVHQDQIEATQQQAVCTASRERGAKHPEDDDDSATQSTPTAGSDDDGGDDERSDGSCVRDRFLDELEEMSQQSGQDLPLEWELTSAAVAHAGGSSGAGMFERDQTGSGSVWEVFDGRCLRQDCREVRHRYNNLFHWLSKICRIPSTPTHLAQGGSQDSQGNSEPQPGQLEGQGKDQVEGWVASEAEELDSHILRQIFWGRDTPVEGLLQSTGSLNSEQENKENVPMTEIDLLSRLLSNETEKISLEQRINSHQQLFSQERRELQQRGSDLQARCDDLESCNRALSEQLADSQLKYKLVQQTDGQQEPGNKTTETGDWPEEAHSKTRVETVERGVQLEKEPCQQEMPETCPERIATTWGEEKKELMQQISTTKAALVSQREENGHYQETIAQLEEQCALLNAQIQTAEAENGILQSEIVRKRDSEKELRERCEKELRERCCLFTEKLEATRDYEELVQKRDELQDECSSLEVQLTVSETTLSSLRKENQNLSEDNQALSTDLKKLKRTVLHFGDIEKNYKALETRYKHLQEKERRTVHCVQSSVQVNLSDVRETGRSAVGHRTGRYDNSTASEKEKDVKLLQDKIESLKEENKFLLEKINILEEDSKLLQNQSQTMQVRNKLLEYQAETHNSRCEILQADLNYVKERLQEAEALNKSLSNKVQLLDISKQKTARLENENQSLSEELTCLKESDSSLQADCQLLEEKCQALQDELLEATQSSQSLREQLHEQSITLEQVISEMKDENSEDNVDQGIEHVEGKHDESREGWLWQAETQSVFVREESEPRPSQWKLEEVIREKDELIGELKEQMTALSLQQAALGAPPTLPQSARDLEQEVQELREEGLEKDSMIQELQEMHQALKDSQAELKRKIKEDSDLEQEVSILHQALFEKEKVIQELKETSKLLHLSQQETTLSLKRQSTDSRSSGQIADRRERSSSQEERRNLPTISDSSYRRTGTMSSRSMESTDSLAISSDPDSDISPGQDMDIVREMGRLRKDIKKTKAVYANESALFQEALDREPVSHLAHRNSRSPSLTIDVSEMTPNDIPNDSEQLKKIVVKLLEENKCLTTENLRLQLRIREQEALVVEMEEKLQNMINPPDDWQTLFERQLLLLQKQRDELQHLICDRDSGVGLLSIKIGKEGVEASALQLQQEDLTVKIGELEHCHQLLQQRQAELAHCQAEKRHLEQILLLKDETERQLMRQKRLLEEELSTIEGKLQDREATLVEEKARLLKELKEKEQHIVHLQSSKANLPQQTSSQPQAVLRGGPQSASTPCVSKTFQASQAYFMQPLSPEEQDPSVLHKSEEGAHGGSFLEEPTVGPIPANIPPKSSFFPTEESKQRAVCQPAEGRVPNRRHSTGTSGSGRLSPAVNPLPRDPSEMYKFHREAVDRLREKLRLQEEEMAQVTEGQTSAIADYWQRRGNQPP
ncbi:hypothetical protein ACOMHN_058987 [Nucella lapillus]